MGNPTKLIGKNRREEVHMEGVKKLIVIGFT
jgi:hypothetical protein